MRTLIRENSCAELRCRWHAGHRVRFDLCPAVASIHPGPGAVRRSAASSSSNPPVGAAQSPAPPLPAWRYGRPPLWRGRRSAERACSWPSCAVAAPSCCSMSAVRRSSRSRARALSARSFAIGIWMLMLPSSAPSQNGAVNATDDRDDGERAGRTGWRGSRSGPRLVSSWVRAGQSRRFVSVRHYRDARVNKERRITPITMALATDD